MKKTEITFDRRMYYGAKHETKERAKHFRNELTESECRLWQIVRNRRLHGYKFRRQHPIDIFIADFYCHQLKLVVEVDGEMHEKSDQKSWDISRSAELNVFGIEVIRFTNSEVIEQPGKVMNALISKCAMIESKQKYFQKQ